MNRILVTVLGLFFLAVIVSPLSVKAIDDSGWLSADAPNGVYCEINEVKLFALSAEDCAKAGGVVTHTVTTTVMPADKASDNPE